MQKIVCPHCGHEGALGAKVPKEVVVALPCPACHDLVVLFRRKVIGLKRAILEHGSFEERKAHIADAIAQFLEPHILPEILGAWPSEGMGSDDEADSEEEQDDQGAEPSWNGEELDDVITSEEFQRFVQVDLKMLDDRNYFRKHFSK